RMLLEPEALLGRASLATESSRTRRRTAGAPCPDVSRRSGASRTAMPLGRGTPTGENDCLAALRPLSPALFHRNPIRGSQSTGTNPVRSTQLLGETWE